MLELTTLNSLKIKITTPISTIFNEIEIESGDDTVDNTRLQELMNMYLIRNVIYEIPIGETVLYVSYNGNNELKLNVHNFSTTYHFNKVQNGVVYELIYERGTTREITYPKNLDANVTVQDLIGNSELTVNFTEGYFGKRQGLFSKALYDTLMNEGFQPQTTSTMNFTTNTKEKVVFVDLRRFFVDRTGKILLNFTNSLVEFNILISLSNDKLTITKKGIIFKNNFQLFNNENQIGIEISKNSNKLLVNCDFSRLKITETWNVSPYFTTPKSVFDQTIPVDSGEFNDGTDFIQTSFFTINSSDVEIYRYDVENKVLLSTNSNNINNIRFFDLTEKSFDADKYLPKLSYENKTIRYIVDKNNRQVYKGFSVDTTITFGDNEYPELIVGNYYQLLIIYDVILLQNIRVYKRDFVDGNKSSWYRLDNVDINSLIENDNRQFIDKRTKDLLLKSYETTPQNQEYPTVKVNNLQVTTGDADKVMLSNGDKLPLNQLRSHIIKIPKNSLGGGTSVDYKVTLDPAIITKLGNFVHVAVFEKTGEE